MDFTILEQIKRLGLRKKIIAQKRNLTITLSFKDDYIIVWDSQKGTTKKFTSELEFKMIQQLKDNNYTLNHYINN